MTVRSKKSINLSHFNENDFYYFLVIFYSNSIFFKRRQNMIKIGKSISDVSFYSCQPKTKEELKKIIKERIDKEGPKCDLNDIDVSLIDDMSYMFVWSCFMDISQNGT